MCSICSKLHRGFVDSTWERSGWNEGILQHAWKDSQVGGEERMLLP